MADAPAPSSAPQEGLDDLFEEALGPQPGERIFFNDDDDPRGIITFLEKGRVCFTAHKYGRDVPFGDRESRVHWYADNLCKGEDSVWRSMDPASLIQKKLLMAQRWEIDLKNLPWAGEKIFFQEKDMVIYHVGLSPVEDVVLVQFEDLDTGSIYETSIGNVWGSSSSCWHLRNSQSVTQISTRPSTDPTQVASFDSAALSTRPGCLGRLLPDGFWRRLHDAWQGAQPQKQ